MAHGQWKRNVHKAVAVYVTYFPAPNAKFRASKTMRRVRDLFPSRNRLVDLLARSRNRHSLTSWGQKGLYSLLRVIGCASERPRSADTIETMPMRGRRRARSPEILTWDKADSRSMPLVKMRHAISWGMMASAAT